MIRINTMFPDDIVQTLDVIAKEERTTRSKLLRKAIHSYIENYQRIVEQKKREDRIRKAIALQDTLRDKSGEWDGASEIRKWRDNI